MITLDTPIESVPRISRKIVPALKRLGIRRIRDLLLHFPARYDDFSLEKAIGDVAAGETVTITGTIQRISQMRTARKKMHMTEVVIGDDTGTMKAIWFNQPFLARTLTEGTRVCLSGKITMGSHGPCLQNPAHEKMTRLKSHGVNAGGIHTGRLVAIYPETDGISSRWLRFLITSFLPLAKNIFDPLPPETRARHGLPEIKDAIAAMHFPRDRDQARNAQHRFIFESLFFIQLRAMRERSRLKQEKAPEITSDVTLLKRFVGSLPFPLTDAQRRSIWEAR